MPCLSSMAVPSLVSDAQWTNCVSAKDHHERFVRRDIEPATYYLDKKAEKAGR